MAMSPDAMHDAVVRNLHKRRGKNLAGWLKAAYTARG